ncbi:MFS general substrate transporter [Acephala macrosclerotiorum]|nr:MFS general substrate transporter [Acephala macrosclerotiorum]
MAIQRDEKVLGPYAYALRSSNAFVILVVSAATFTDTFLYDLILPIIPNILQDKLGIPIAEVTTWVSILQGTFGATFLFTPMLLGIYGSRDDSKRGPFLAGLVVLAIATLLFFLGTHISILIIARLLQGASSAFIWTSGIDFLNSRVGSEAAGHAMSWFMMATSFGELLGPISGGVIYDHAGQLAVFGVAASVILVDGVLRLLVVDKKVASDDLDGCTDSEPEGAMQSLLSENVHAEIGIYGALNIPAPQVEDEYSADGDTAAVSHSNWRIFIRDTDFMISLIAALLTSTTRSALETALPIYVQTTFNWSPSLSGLIILCTLAPSLLSPLISHITSISGPRYISTIALFILGALFLTVGVWTSVSEVLFCVLITGIGISLFTAQIPHMVAFTMIANKSYEEICMRAEREKKKQSVQVYAAMNVAFAAGLLVGPAWVGLIQGTFGWTIFCVLFGVAEVGLGTLTAFSWKKWKRAEEQG